MLWTLIHILTRDEQEGAEPTHKRISSASILLPDPHGPDHQPDWALWQWVGSGGK